MPQSTKDLMLTFLDDVRVGYNSYTLTLDVNIMPNFIHDCHQPWLINEIWGRMVPTGFITPAEASLLQILSGTSKCHCPLLRSFSTDSEQLLKLLDPPMSRRPSNQINVSFQKVRTCQPLSSSLGGRNPACNFTGI